MSDLWMSRMGDAGDLAVRSRPVIPSGKVAPLPLPRREASGRAGGIAGQLRDVGPGSVTRGGDAATVIS
jgi:hypothetical protein